MSVDSNLPSMQRPAFAPGQLLTAGDLSAAQDSQTHQRWLHNSTLHPWGIAKGLQVIGERGARDVQVYPGYAIDCHGRELVVPDLQTVSVPPIAGSDTSDAEPEVCYLTATYPEEAIVSLTRAGVCAPEAAVRVDERAVLGWQRRKEISAAFETWRGTNIILATVGLRDCRLAAPVSLADRREARPAGPPYVFAGATTSGATAWRWWPDNAPPAQAYGVATTVDTSVAGYQRVPRYFAQVAGERKIGSHWLDGLPRVDKTTPTNFELVVALPRDVPVFTDLNLKLNPGAAFSDATLASLSKKWHVVWVGVELWPS